MGSECRAGLRHTLFTLAVGVSSALLFSVQLLFVKMTLPVFGGTPVTWNTAVLFFQSVLLLGYFYAHVMRMRLQLHHQMLLHGALLLAACALLPVHIVQLGGEGGTEPSIRNLLAILAGSVGLPFFALSATSPLLQHWLTRTTHRDARDPYFLYAASNVGSMLGLFAYPFALEPFLGLRAQSAVWTAGYFVLVGLLFLSAIVVWMDAHARLPSSRPTNDARSVVTAQQRVRWTLFACIPSSLMLGVTTYLSDVIASIPMLWMIPLATYLLTLIIAFSRPSRFVRTFAARTPIFAVLALALCMILTHASLVVFWIVWLHAALLFVLALTCHRRLAEEKPGAAHLTEFYLWVSVGGALGGAFNVLIAPVLFPNVLEYPLAICAAVALERICPPRSAWRRKIADIVFSAAMSLQTLLLISWHALASAHLLAAERLFFTSALSACLASATYPRRLAVALASLFTISMFMPSLRGSQLTAQRDFFGIKEVFAFTPPDSRWSAHRLAHGGTIHGVQSLDPAFAHTPLGYYHPRSPLGDLMMEQRMPKSRAIGVVGLGVGTTACFAQPAERWTFYEIDPAVLRIARDPRYFSYLASCAPQAEVVIGDARLSLRADTSSRYDIFILDAYSSDQIPLHLITREALSIYLAHLRPGGVLAFHISNRNFDLHEVLGNLATDAGLAAFLRSDGNGAGELASLKFGSVWVLMARSRADFGTLLQDQRWHTLPAFPDLPLWTDDYSSLIRVMSRR